MKCLIFLQLNDYYALINSNLIKEEDFDFTKVRLCSADKIKGLKDGQTISRSKLRKVCGENFNIENNNYIIRKEDSNYLLIPMSLRDRLGFRTGSTKTAIKDSRYAITRFNLLREKKLLSNLIEKEKGWSNYLRDIADYAFCEHYLLWIYNPETKYFTLFDSSINNYPKDYITPDDKKLGLQVFYEGGFSSWEGTVSDTTMKEKGMKSLNRIRLDIGIFDERTKGILDLYSKYEKFALAEREINHIKNSIEKIYKAERGEAQLAINEINRYFIEEYKPGEIDNFLYGLTVKVCELFYWGCCAIFLKVPKEERLYLKAICGATHPDGKPMLTEEREKFYNLTESALTTTVYKNQRPQFSYELEEDYNKGIARGRYDDTEHPIKNWIGVPILSESGREPWGILNVTNKYEEIDYKGKKEKRITYFPPIDSICLEMICSGLSNLLHIEQEREEIHKERIRIAKLYEETNAGRIKVAKQYEELRDFNMVFLHEIRTPISQFSTSPLRIQKLLEKTSLKKEDIAPIINKLNDIRIMGERLAFITDIYNVEELISIKKPEVLSLLADIILPVLNITQDYLSIQYGLDIIIIEDSLKTQVYGDKTLLQLVMNTLINNAGKYFSEPKKPICIYGKPETKRDGKFFNVFVESYTLRIYEDEKDRIFEKGFRGREVIEQKIRGAGIGIYLAKSIMKKHGGDITLTKLNEPVTFEIKIPLA